MRIALGPLAVIVLHALLAAVFGHHRELDPGFHFLGGLAGAVALRQAMARWPTRVSARLLNAPGFTAVGAVAVVAVLWEIAEWASDHWLGSHIQQGWLDTGPDVVLGIVGALCGNALAARTRGNP